MAQLPDRIMPTIDAIYQKYEEKNDKGMRPHLGASIIGHPCDRYLWYSFRWCGKAVFNGRMQRLFETGTREEARVIQNLKDIGIEIYDRDPKNPSNQIQYADKDCPHFSGSLDGIGKGFREAPKTWHVVEIKTMNTKEFKKLQKDGVKLTKPQHYAQMQIYMHWSKLTRAYYFCVCKETDEIYGERINYDKKEATEIRERAIRIINSDEPLDRFTTKQSEYKCLDCEFRDICWHDKLPLVNCRTCAHLETKTYPCECNNGFGILHSENCTKPCNKHIFIPALVPLVQIDAEEEIGTITYEIESPDGADTEIINGPGNTSSEELREMINSED